MLKKILKLKGAQELTKKEQLNIKGSWKNDFTFCCPEDNNISYPDCSFIECLR